MLGLTFILIVGAASVFAVPAKTVNR
jgi:hypothetical protein